MAKARQIGSSLNKLLRSAVRKRGIADADMPARWAEIVPEYKDYSRPLKMYQGTLTIASNSSSAAHNMQMQGDLLIQRINTFFGYNAVKSIKFVIRSFTEMEEIAKMTRLKIGEEAEAKSAKMCDSVTNKELKEKLQGLGEAVFQDNINKNK